MQSTASSGYTTWMAEVKAALDSINMGVDDWQNTWPFDFEQEYRSGSTAIDAAHRANRFWWFNQNRSLNKNCRLTANCWLPNGHQGVCQTL